MFSRVTLLHIERIDHFKQAMKAIKGSLVTMMILAHFPRAFETICFRNLISKMSKLVFSRDFLMWTLNYVTHRKQFVQIDDTYSYEKNVNSGIPGFILGLVLFNIYVADPGELRSQMLPVCGRHNNLRPCQSIMT